MKTKIATAVTVIAAIVPLILAPVGPAYAASWQFSTPAPAAHLFGISAASTNDVWAVGSIFGHPIIEHWGGTQWAVVTSPPLPFGSGELHAVTSLPSGKAWAVGTQTSAPDGEQSTLIETWTGSKWRVVPSPNVFQGGPTDSNYLYAVSTISRTDVWAAGRAHRDGQPEQTIIEHWDGVSWTLSSSLSPGTQLNWILGISMTATSGLAVGVQSDQSEHALAERWAKGSWRLARIPSARNLWLYGVLALTNREAWAVGWQGSGIAYPMIEHFVKGLGWQTVSPGTSDRGALSGIAASSASDMWAVGADDDHKTDAFILHWDGSAWTQVAGPSTPTSFIGLSKVAIVPGSIEAWAVGEDENGPVILHYA